MRRARTTTLTAIVAGTVTLACATLAVACASSSSKPSPAVSALPSATTSSASSASATSSAPSAATTAPAGGPAAVTVVDFAFKPASLTVKAGTPVVWTNKDAFAHSVRSNDGTFDEQTMKAGQTATVTFAKPGTYAYVCGIHNSMTGTVVVTA